MTIVTKKRAEVELFKIHNKEFSSLKTLNQTVYVPLIYFIKCTFLFFLSDTLRRRICSVEKHRNYTKKNDFQKQETSITRSFFDIGVYLNAQSENKSVQMCPGSPVCTGPLFPCRKHSPLASWVAQISKCAVNSAPWLCGRKQSNQYIINHRFNVAKPDVDKH